ncbi:MAG: antibiotic biosynthesis monooxygenase [Actinomycetia bacterium]|nr:antibiotic biosynthesis monooxygenase [Actinomycetes bacterium]MCP3910154.1 antibiotic biosynthesis monooxygenase [Actinomycetes bacterium]MCP4087690.1 antibiotic biosynthesis monooxygenase [Actinomycetes bacterium]
MAKTAVIAKITAAEGKRDELAAGLQKMLPVVEGEAGTEIYALHADKGDENILWFYELYTDDEALGVHGASDGMKETMGSLRDLFGARAEIILLDPVAAKGINF